MTNFFKALWQRSSSAGRAILIAGSLAAVAIPVGAYWWMNKADYQVLFSDLDSRDAAAVVAALDKQKTPYQLADDGKTVQVEKDVLYKTRMKLLGGGLDLKGSVGFELFNNAEFGVTEFAQKINYQRALQGELARTIMGFDEVNNARVHLVLPEGGMLRKRGGKAKASVWVTLKGSKVLQQEQVMGIQRLVAASVPEMDSSAVTVLDQRGVALSAREMGDDGVVGADASLQLKKETETYLADKVSRILDAALGPNQAAVSVDVILDMSAQKLTKESVVGDGTDKKGVLVRRHEQWQGDGDISRQTQTASGSGVPVGNKSMDVEYQVGRELHQTSIGSGSVKRISVGVVTNTSLSDTTVERLRGVIAMAVGLDSVRGDGIAFSVLDNIQAVSASQTMAEIPGAETSTSTRARPPVVDFGPAVLWVASAILLAVIGTIGWLLRRRYTRKSLSEAEREQLLRQVQSWLAAEQTGSGN